MGTEEKERHSLTLCGGGVHKLNNRKIIQWKTVELGQLL